MADADLLVMTHVTPRRGLATPALAAAGDLFGWLCEQPGFAGGDVLVDPQDASSFWLAERWASRTLRDAARLDPAGARRLAALEALLERDEVAAYVPVDRFPHGESAPDDALSAWTTTAGGAPVARAADDRAPTVLIARFHLRPGTHDRFVAAERRHGDSLDGTGVVSLQVARHADDPNRLCHYEVWRSPESHQAYADSYERQRFLADVAEFLVAPEPSESLRLHARYAPRRTPRPRADAPLVPPVDRARLRPEARQAIESAPPVAFFDTIAHAQVALKPQIDLMLALMAKDIALKQRLRMLAVLQVLVTGGVAYEWNRQLEPALAAGVTQDEIDAIATGWRGSALFGDDDRLVLRATSEVLALGRASATTFTTLVHDLGAASAIELLLNIGHFRSMGQIILSAQLQPEPAPAQADDRPATPG